jgi:hypothetical protein
MQAILSLELNKFIASEKYIGFKLKVQKYDKCM